MWRPSRATRTDTLCTCTTLGRSGGLEGGIGFIRQAIGLDRSVAVTSRLALALAFLRKGQYQQASDAARGEGQGSNFTYWSLMSAIHGKAGRLEEARFAAAELLKLHPDFADWAWKRSEEHTSELQSLMRISYAVFCLKK